MSKKTESFTLTELIIVVILLGLLAAFALPNYGKAISKTDERHAITNMIATRSAVKLYLVNAGVATVPNWANANAINAALDISILDSKMTYQCNINLCTTTHNSAGWEIGFHLIGTGAHNTDGSIHCTDTSCPSCPEGGSGDCG